eukprot:SAG11_NODE_281_length_11257_cov_45.949633_8_plen_574_part_00
MHLLTMHLLIMHLLIMHLLIMHLLRADLSLAIRFAGAPQAMLNEVAPEWAAEGIECTPAEFLEDASSDGAPLRDVPVEESHTAVHSISGRCSIYLRPYSVIPRWYTYADVPVERRKYWAAEAARRFLSHTSAASTRAATVGVSSAAAAQGDRTGRRHAASATTQNLEVNEAQKLKTLAVEKAAAMKAPKPGREAVDGLAHQLSPKSAFIADTRLARELQRELQGMRGGARSRRRVRYDPAVEAARPQLASSKATAAAPPKGGGADGALCVVCNSSEDGERMLLCDGCDGGYHLYCCAPKLQAVPDDDWYCATCAKAATVAARARDATDHGAGAMASPRAERWGEKRGEKGQGEEAGTRHTLVLPKEAESAGKPDRRCDVSGSRSRRGGATDGVQSLNGVSRWHEQGGAAAAAAGARATQAAAAAATGRGSWAQRGGERERGERRGAEGSGGERRERRGAERAEGGEQARREERGRESRGGEHRGHEVAMFMSTWPWHAPICSQGGTLSLWRYSSSSATQPPFVALCHTRSLVRWEWQYRHCLRYIGGVVGGWSEEAASRVRSRSQAAGVASPC